MPKVSVIIPIYGVEKYIERCVRSLFEQTLQDMEFVFVNDCTPDRSMDVLRSLVSEYSAVLKADRKTVHILDHDVNRGLPAARRTGMGICSGEYVVHCDSDDWVDRDMYRAMYEKAVQDDADMVVVDFCITDGTNEKVTNPVGFSDKDDMIRKTLSRRQSWSLCNKLIRRSLYDEDIVYPERNAGEDFALCMQCILRAERISFLQKCFYYYYVNTSSITYTTDPARVLRRYQDVKENYRIVRNAFEQRNLYRKYRREFRIFEFYAKNALECTRQNGEYYLLWRSSYPEIGPGVIFNRDIPAEDRFRFILKALRIR